MIDIHCHIIPSLDDGAANLEEAIEMAKRAVVEGITDIITTPHTHNGIYNNSFEQVLASVHLLQQELDRQQIPLKIHPGSEIHIHYELLENLKQKKLMTMANTDKYVLIELPYFSLPVFTDEIFDQLLKEGYLPIIAHPERNIVIQDNPALLLNWVDRGILTQLTAGSLLGKWGKKVQRLSKRMIKRKLVNFIGTDAHNASNRTIELRKTYQMLGKLSGKMAVEQVKGNACSIIQVRC